MWKIIFFWLGIAFAFFVFITFGYRLGLDSEHLILALFLTYYSAQVYSFIRGTWDIRWLQMGIVVQTIFAMVSPLYFSTFWDPVYEYTTGTWFDRSDAFVPCRLCWWTRIMMFPLVPLSIIYLVSRSRALLWYIFGVSIAGILLESYHYSTQLNRTLFWQFFEGCSTGPDCSEKLIGYFDFITIPLLAVMAFTLIAAFSARLLFSKKCVPQHYAPNK